MSILNSITNWIQRHGGLREIIRWDSDNQIYQKYLWRYYIYKSPLCEVMIHRFWDGDEGPLHDHPWNNFSVILKRGYVEETPNGKFRRKPGYVGFRKAEMRHKVHINPNYSGEIWTLFVTFRRRRIWGFHAPNGWISFQDYHNQFHSDEPQSSPGEYSTGLFPKKVA